MARGAAHLRRRLPVPAVLPLCLVVAACLCGGGNAAAAAERTKAVGVHELRRGDDFSIKVTNWGATLMSVILPDSRGNLADVVLGYDTVAEYVNGTAYFGGLIGRVANRIAGARFTLDGKAYRLYPNDGNNSLHGGHRGFSKVIWTVKEHVAGGDSPHITLYYHSFDGEQGFPGDLDVYVTYQLSPPHVLSVRMNATARGRTTPVNLAHHAYWNLGSHGSGPVLGERSSSSRPGTRRWTPRSSRRARWCPWPARPTTSARRRSWARAWASSCAVAASRATTSTTPWTAPRRRPCCGGWRVSGTARRGGRWSCGRTSPACSSTPATGSAASGARAAACTSATARCAWRRRGFPTP